MSLELKNIIKSYDGERNVLNGVNLKLNSTGLYGIVGRSGCGKSTLINIISGLDTTTSGEILLDGVDYSKYNQKLVDNVSVIYQDYHLLDELNVIDNIKIAIELGGGKFNYKEVHKTMVELGIDELEKRNVQFLSGGESQRVAIARSYMSGKPIIVADEPTGNLDRENAHKVFQMLRKISETKLVIIVSHDRGLIQHYIKNVILINRGKAEYIDDDENEKPIAINDRKSKIGIGNAFKMSFQMLFKRKAICICLMLLTIISTTLFASSLSLFEYSDYKYYRIWRDYTPYDNMETNTMPNQESKELVSLFEEGKIVRGEIYWGGNIVKAHSADKEDGTFGIIGTISFQYIGEYARDIDQSQLIMGRAPQKFGEFIISEQVYTAISYYKNIYVGVDEFNNRQYMTISTDDVWESIDSMTWDFHGITIKLVGVFEDKENLTGSEENGNSSETKNWAIFKPGIIKEIRTNNPYKYYISKRSNSGHGLSIKTHAKENFSYEVCEGKVGQLSDLEKEYLIRDFKLIDVDGKQSRLPNDNEIILEALLLDNGEVITTYDIGDKIQVTTNTFNGAKRECTVVGYYYDDSKNYDWVLENRVVVGAYLNEKTLSEMMLEEVNVYENIIASYNMSEDMYYTLLNNTDVKINEMSSDMRLKKVSDIAITITTVFLAITLLLNCILIIRTSKQSIAKLYGIGAKSKQLSAMSIIMALSFGVIVIPCGLLVSTGLSIMLSYFYALHLGEMFRPGVHIPDVFSITAFEILAVVLIILAATSLIMFIAMKCINKKKLIESIRA